MWLLLACGTVEKQNIEDTDTAEVVLAEPTYQYSIAILADPHISGNAEHTSRLEQAIGWINDHAEARQIELVPVLGDVGWGEGLSTAKSVLDMLEVPYLPIIGDNEIQYGDEENFATVFAPQMEWLADNTESWNYGGVSVWNPEESQDSYFTNFAFTHKEVRLVALDWASRLPSSEGIWTEFGYLHDFEGGSFPFLENELVSFGTAKDNSTIFLTHIPMSVGSFNAAQMDAFETMLAPYTDKIYANFAGHLHVNVEEENLDRGYDLHVTNAVWDDVITIRILDVYQNAQEVRFEQEIVEFAWTDGSGE